MEKNITFVSRRKYFVKRVQVVLITFSFFWLILGQLVLITHRKNEEVRQNSQEEVAKKALPIATTFNIARNSEEKIQLQTNSTKNSRKFYGVKYHLTAKLTNVNNASTFQKLWKLSNCFNCSAFNQFEEKLASFDIFNDDRKLEALQFQKKKHYVISRRKIDENLNKNSKQYRDSEKLFGKQLEILDILLRMQSWPGIPQIAGVCIKNEKGEEITKNYGNNAFNLRYVLSLPDINFPLCRPSLITDDCISFKSLKKTLHLLPDSAKIALKILRSFAITFENFQKLGAFPTRLRYNDVIVTSDYEILFTSVQQFAFLDSISMGNGITRHQRLLSDLSCRLSSDCPRFETQQEQKAIKHCSEVQGHCDVQNRCWGVDATSYLYYFSKSIFANLFEIVKNKWKRKSSKWKDIETILKCTSQPIPERRCGWTTFKNVVDDVLKVY